VRPQHGRGQCQTGLRRKALRCFIVRAAVTPPRGEIRQAHLAPTHGCCRFHQSGTSSARRLPARPRAIQVSRGAAAGRCCLCRRYGLRVSPSPQPKSTDACPTPTSSARLLARTWPQSAASARGRSRSTWAPAERRRLPSSAAAAPGSCMARACSSVVNCPTTPGFSRSCLQAGLGRPRRRAGALRLCGAAALRRTLARTLVAHTCSPSLSSPLLGVPAMAALTACDIGVMRGKATWGDAQGLAPRTPTWW
jgi:hypothetical protein